MASAHIAIMYSLRFRRILSRRAGMPYVELSLGSDARVREDQTACAEREPWATACSACPKHDSRSDDTTWAQQARYYQRFTQESSNCSKPPLASKTPGRQPV